MTAIIAHALAMPPTSRSAAHTSGVDVAAIAAVVTTLTARPALTVGRRPARLATGLADAAPRR